MTIMILLEDNDGNLIEVNNGYNDHDIEMQGPLIITLTPF